MNPALLQMIMEQQSQQAPSFQPQNPISSGASQGIDAARNSLRMSDYDRQRALGLALIHFGKNINRPEIGEDGSGSSLTRFSRSLSPAAEAYMGAEQDAFNRNLMLQKMETERLQQEARERLEREKLEEMKRYHSGMLDRQTKDERTYQLGQRKMQSLQKDFPGAVPFEFMSQAEQRDTGNRLRKLNSQSKQYEKMIDDLYKLKKIIKGHPNLSTSMTAAWYPEGDGVIKTAMRSGMNQKEKTALDLAKKYTNDILSNKIVSANNTRPTDLLKKVFGSTMPDLTKNTDEANNLLIDDLLDEFEPMYEYVKLTPAMLSGRFEIPIPISGLKHDQVTKSENEINSNSLNSIDSELADIDRQLGINQ